MTARNGIHLKSRQECHGVNQDGRLSIFRIVQFILLPQLVRNMRFQCDPNTFGPSNMTRVIFLPRTSSASWKRYLAALEALYKSFPIPTHCEPWPGKRIARISPFVLPTMASESIVEHKVRRKPARTQQANKAAFRELRSVFYPCIYK